MIYLPMFPLSLVAFPHEQLNLHIFEPRYKQLIKECVENQTTFGIPAFIDGKLMPLGTEMLVSKIVKTYESGEMDISTLGVRIFEIKEFFNPYEDKLYPGATILFQNFEHISEEVDPTLFKMVERFYQQLNRRFDYQVSIPQPYSFRLAHKLGLSLEQEYQLLSIPTEKLRQAFLLEHLRKVLPIMENLERTKDRIAMNGHFKNLDPLKF